MSSFKNLIFIISVMFTLQIYSQSYAPVVPVPSNPDNDPDISLGIMFIKAVEVPDKATVGVDAYPGAEILQTTKSQDPMLASIRLVSSDEVQKVYEFYKEKLKDWNYENFMGMHVFWKGEKMEALVLSSPVVQIEEATKYMKVTPNAKTTILVGYK